MNSGRLSPAKSNMNLAITFLGRVPSYDTVQYPVGQNFGMHSARIFQFWILSRFNIPRLFISLLMDLVIQESIVYFKYFRVFGFQTMVILHSAASCFSWKKEAKVMRSSLVEGRSVALRFNLNLFHHLLFFFKIRVQELWRRVAHF